MSIISQTLTDNQLTIEATGGRIFSITRAEVRAIYQSKNGSRNSRINQTIADIANAIETALGSETVDINTLLLSFDDLDGSLKRCEWYTTQADRDAAAAQ